MSCFRFIVSLSVKRVRGAGGHIEMVDFSVFIILFFFVSSVLVAATLKSFYFFI